MYYIFVEGPDDKRFFSSLFASVFNDPQIIEYSKLTQNKINSFINTITYRKDASYLFIADADGKTIDEKRNCILKKYHTLNRECVIIVQFEIESWYYAGASEELCKTLNLKHYQFDANYLTKEQFYYKLPSMEDRIYIMNELLNGYSFALARSRNNSFKLFYDEYGQ